jgi:hypothetical protein
MKAEFKIYHHLQGIPWQRGCFNVCGSTPMLNELAEKAPIRLLKAE